MYDGMSFSDLHFIFIYLPVFLCLYYAAAKIFKSSTRVANLVLFFGSIIFYALGAVGQLPYLIAALSVNYFIPLLIEKYGVSFSKRKMKTFFFIILTVFDVGLLLYFKIIVGKMPMGLSFYIFQMISYAADVYMDRICAEKDFINFGTYVIMFPRLVQGPLGKYEDVSERLNYRKFEIELFYKGLVYFITGLSFKVIIADRIGLLWSTEIARIGYESISTQLAWMGAFAYSFELYYDFFGYSLMAVGLGYMLGFELANNFDNPYASLSLTEFWRRWHVTLGTWFKDYIYIPLGGNRKGKMRLILNLFIVWAVTGLWHGFGFNYMIWAMVIFIIIVLEKLFFGKFLSKENIVGRVIGHIYILFLVPLTWVVFAIEKIDRLGIYFARLFPLFGNTVGNVNQHDYIKYFGMYYPYFILAIIFCIPFITNSVLKMHKKWFSVAICMVLFGICVLLIGRGLNNPFMYAVF